jgi:hypothetical protein
MVAIDPISLVNQVDMLSLVAQVGSIALWLKAIGGIVVLWIIFEGFGFYWNIQRFRKMEHIQEDMKRMERKLNKILDKKK